MKSYALAGDAAAMSSAAARITDLHRRPWIPASRSNRAKATSSFSIIEPPILRVDA
jgi:hypothetical protein